MRRLSLHPTPLDGLIEVERHRLGDSRGFFARLFCAHELAEAGWHTPIAQINHTHTARAGTVRGMHWQRAPHEEMKLVTCIRGEVWDVAVDVRPHSPTHLRWHAVRLSATNGRALLIPPGFAHGFQAQSDDVELIYCHSHPHVPNAEAGLHPQDPRLAIAWPLPVVGLSARDQSHPLLTDTAAPSTP
jgi:dTDP-4-dehydrorhamnose 3,5-epimerase